MQMSQSEIFIFIEGKSSDGFVHGQNCDRALAELNVQYELVRSDQLGTEGSGKTRLLSHFELLCGQGRLADEFKGKKTLSIFFMDKDLDDFRGNQINSKHVIYTRFYDVENHIFHEGNLQLAVSASCNFSPQQVRQEYPDTSEWRTRIAGYWRAWVRLCFTANLLKLEGEVNYGRPSPVNTLPDAPPDADLVSQYEQRSHKTARRLHAGSCRDWSVMRAQVDALYEQGRQDEVFKGKWYAEILAKCLLSSGYDIDKRALASVLVRQMAATMTFDSDWSREVQSRVKELAVYAAGSFPLQYGTDDKVALEGPAAPHVLYETD